MLTHGVHLLLHLVTRYAASLHTATIAVPHITHVILEPAALLWLALLRRLWYRTHLRWLLRLRWLVTRQPVLPIILRCLRLVLSTTTIGHVGGSTLRRRGLRLGWLPRRLRCVPVPQASILISGLRWRCWFSKVAGISTTHSR